MRRIKMLASVLFGIILVLGGCQEKMTAPRLVETMRTAVQTSPITGFTMDVELDATLATNNLTIDLDAELVGSTILSTQPHGSFWSMELALEGYLQQSIQLYTREEDSQLAAYLSLESHPWVREVIPSHEMSSHDWLLNLPPEQLTLAEESVDIQDTTAYVLTCTFTGADMFPSAEGDAAASHGLDLSTLSVVATCYVDLQSHLPLKIELDCSGPGTLSPDVWYALAGTQDTRQVPGTVSLENCRIVLDDISYEEVTLPVLPAEAAQAVPWKELTSAADTPIEPEEVPEVVEEVPQTINLGPGPFSMRLPNIQLTITLPQGWFATEVHNDLLYFLSEDERASGDFILYTPEESSYQTMQTNLDDSLYYWITTQEYHSHGKLELPDWYAFWVRFDNGSIHFYGIRSFGKQGHLLFSLYHADGSLSPEQITGLLSTSISL